MRIWRTWYDAPCGSIWGLKNVFTRSRRYGDEIARTTRAENTAGISMANCHNGGPERKYIASATPMMMPAVPKLGCIKINHTTIPIKNKKLVSLPFSLRENHAAR